MSRLRRPASGNFCSACGASLVAAKLRGLPGRPVAAGAVLPSVRPAGRRAGRAAAGLPARERTAWLVAGALCVVLLVLIVLQGRPRASRPRRPRWPTRGAERPETVGRHRSRRHGRGPGAGHQPDVPARAVRSAVQPDHAGRGAAATPRRSTASRRWRSAPTPSSTPWMPTPAITPRCSAAGRPTCPAPWRSPTRSWRQNPGHLFGYVIRGKVAGFQGDTARQLQAQRDFQAHFAAESAAGRVGVPGAPAGHRRIQEEAETRIEGGQVAPRQFHRFALQAEVPCPAPSASPTAPIPTTRSCSTRSPRARSTPATCATSTSCPTSSR